MSLRFDHLKRLGDRVAVQIPSDEHGYLGRECPKSECESYFKIKPGTGLSGDDLQCYCPYCGHKGPHDHFWTKDQIEYAESVALRNITDAIHKDLKSLEFDHKPRGDFGIGVSMKLKHGPPLPVRYYREQELETQVLCNECSLEYSVFGVFGYCPDCAVHNSLQILQKNLDLTRKQLDLAEGVEDSELSRHLIEDALENCISAFDSFGREACRIRAAKSTAPEQCATLSFQNLRRAHERLQVLFNIDLTAAVSGQEWNVVQRAFMRRHLLAHKAGVIDERYVEETGESRLLLGRRLTILPDDIRALSYTLDILGRELIDRLPQPR